MKIDGFDMILNGCVSDTLSIRKRDKYFEFNIIEESHKGKDEFCTLLSRDELVELKVRIELLLDLTEEHKK